MIFPGYLSRNQLGRENTKIFNYGNDFSYDMATIVNIFIHQTEKLIIYNTSVIY